MFAARGSTARPVQDRRAWHLTDGRLHGSRLRYELDQHPPDITPRLVRRMAGWRRMTRADAISSTTLHGVSRRGCFAERRRSTCVSLLAICVDESLKGLQPQEHRKLRIGHLDPFPVGCVGNAGSDRKQVHHARAAKSAAVCSSGRDQEGIGRQGPDVSDFRPHLPTSPTTRKPLTRSRARKQ